MRKNRFLRTALCAIPIFLTIWACVYWWVVWPTKVAGRVVELLNQRSFRELSPLLATDDDREFLDYLEYIARDVPEPARDAFSTTPRNRTWTEVFSSRQQFVLGFHFEIVVVRGRVSFPGSEYFRNALEQRQQKLHEKEFYERYPELREVSTSP